MTGHPDALIVTAATWTAVAVGGYLVCSWARAWSPVAAAAVVVVAVAATAGGVAGADAPHPRPVPSLDWGASGRTGTPAAARVTVRPGDCLWRIAEHALAHPTSARVAAGWPRWWQRNRSVIGPDPNLIRPGQRLRPPSARPRRP